MKSRFSLLVLFLLMAVMILEGPGMSMSRAMAWWPLQDQQGPEGPNPAPGETVVVPKNAPTTTPPPQAKRPEKINPNNVYTLSTSSNLVNVDVLVEDNNGNPIPNLGRQNFRVLDDGVEQTITNFGTSEVPMTIVLLIEFSNEWWPLLYQSIRESYDFLGIMKPTDWVAVVTFDLKPQILTDFTHNRMQVEAALNQLQFPGFSEINLYDALAFTIDRMKDIQGRKAIIAIVSGTDTFSKLTYDKMLKIAKNSDTPIYAMSILEWIAVRMPGGYNIDYFQARNALNYITKYSGGQAYFPRFEAEVPSVYQQITQQLRTQYSLGFAPTSATRDGRYHRLKVELVDAQGNPLRIVNQKGKAVKYSLKFRDGYYAPKS